MTESRLRPWLAGTRERESRDPVPLRELLDELAAQDPELAPLMALLREKHKLAVAEQVVELEALWHRRLSRFLIRAVLIVGVLGGTGAMLQKAIDPVLAIALFAAGVAAMYVATQIIVMRGEEKDRKQLAAHRARYEQALKQSPG